jgi:hypothetical protein
MGIKRGPSSAAFLLVAVPLSVIIATLTRKIPGVSKVL